MLPFEEPTTGQVFGPVYVPGKVIPILAWTARYPDQHDPVPVQYTGATWTPVLPPTPYGWPAAYVDQHPPTPVQYTGATWTPQLPDTPQGWAATYPDQHALGRLPATAVSFVLQPPVVSVPTVWAATYPDWIATPYTLVRSGATFGADADPTVETTLAAGPMTVQVWPADVRHLFPTVFAPPPQVVAPAPDLWTGVAPSWLPPQPTTQPGAYVAPAGVPIIPSLASWLGDAPAQLTHLRPTQPTASVYPFPTPAPTEVPVGWWPDYPVQLTRLTPNVGPSHVSGFAPIVPAVTGWAAHYPVSTALPLRAQPSGSVEVLPFTAPVPTLWTAVYPSLLAGGRPTTSDPAYFSAILTPSGGGVLFRRSLQNRIGGRTMPTKL